jgi:hypothetical protein
VDDWGKLLGDIVIVAPLLDRLYHHGHMLRFEGKSWRLHEAAMRRATARRAARRKFVFNSIMVGRDHGLR